MHTRTAMPATRAAIWLVLASLFLTTLLSPSALPARAATNSPLSTEITISPESVTLDSRVKVTIRITNEDPEGKGPIQVTLLNPDRRACKDFGQKGTATIAPGESVRYIGMWRINETNLSEKKLTFYACYAADPQADRKMLHMHSVGTGIVVED